MLYGSMLYGSMLRRSMLRQFIFRDFRLRRSTGSLVVFFALAGAITLGLLSNGVTRALAQSDRPQRAGDKTGATADVARGKYLVESVAVCGQCHTPRDSNGNPDRSRWLQGASVPYMPAKPDSDWPINAPRIGGTPPASDADMVKLLTTGIWTNGDHLRSPMPQFRMDRSDAEAVVAYLKSVTPRQ
jgi:mono/diheme cytochrome c family protein